jgi:hypothetical protein
VLSRKSLLLPGTEMNVVRTVFPNRLTTRLPPADTRISSVFPEGSDGEAPTG